MGTMVPGSYGYNGTRFFRVQGTRYLRVLSRFFCQSAQPLSIRMPRRGTVGVARYITINDSHFLKNAGMAIITQGSVRPYESKINPYRTRRDSFELVGYHALIFLIGVSAITALIGVPAITALMGTFTASSMGSLKGTSIRSRPFS